MTLDADGDLQLVVTDDYLHEGLAERNADSLRTGRPWMLAGSAGIEAWVGPVFVPDRGACWECLAHRLRRNRGAHVHPGHDNGSSRVARAHGSLASTEQALVGVVATEVVRWIVLQRASGRGDNLLSLDARTWQSRVHAVAWRPQCPACGDPDASVERGAQPIVLAAASEARAVDGGLRTVAPEATLERLSHHVSPITGVASQLVRAPGTGDPLHAYMAGRLDPVRGSGRGEDWGLTTMVAGGKGATDAQARASALCEALERYSGVFCGDEPRRTATLVELGDAAVHPNASMQFSASQYETREETNAQAQSMRTHVPAPFDPEAPVEWTPVWSLTAGRERLLPTALCYYQAHVAGRESCLADSNGNAAGNTVEEAILQGFLELVERDHVALWWFNRLRQPGLDLAAFEDPWLDRLRAHFADEGRELWALDLTADLGIPVVAALSSPTDGDGAVVMGFGAHLELGLALARAAAELVQLGSGTPSGGLGYGPQEPLRSEEGSYLRPDDGVPLHTPADDPATLSGDRAPRSRRAGDWSSSAGWR